MRQSFFLKLSGLRVQQSNLLKRGMIIDSYNDHVRLLSLEPVGWVSTTNFTRAEEPTLLWNQFHHLRIAGHPRRYNNAPVFIVRIFSAISSLVMAAPISG